MYDVTDVVLLCRMLSAQYRIKIQPGACSASGRFEQAWCRKDDDGYVLQVPFSPHMTEEQWRWLRGYIDHECGHVKFTNFQAYEAMKNSIVGEYADRYDMSNRGRKFLADFSDMVLNILEDVRIERLMGIDFPGSRTNLNLLSEHLFKDCCSVSAMMGDGMAGRLYSLLFMRVRSLINPALEEPARRLYDDMKDDDASDTYTEYIRHLDAVWGIGDIFMQDWNVERSAREFIGIVIEVLKDCMNTAQGTDSNRTSSGRQDGSTAGDTGDGASSEKTHGASINEAIATMDIGLYSMRQSNEGDVANRFLDEMRDATFSPDNLLSDEDRAFLDTMFSRAPERLDTLLDKRKKNVLAGGKPVYVKSDISVQALNSWQRDDVNTVMYNLYGTLADVLQTMTLVRHSTGMCGSRLDSRVLHRASVGDGRIFSRKVQRLRRVTEVALLFDASGSMVMDKYNGGYDNNETAQCMALGCFKALRALPGVRSSLSGFSDGELFTMADYADPVHEVILSARGGTPLGASLVELTSQFSAGHDVRRIILFFTDGFPDHVGSVTMALDMAKRSGIEVYGIGLETNAVRNFMDSDHSMVVKNIHELAGGMCDMLRKGMVKAYEV